MNDFTLPPGYKAWCHECGNPPFNKETGIPISYVPRAMDESQLPEEVQKMKMIPGVGFKSIDDLTAHTRDFHRVWKG